MRNYNLVTPPAKKGLKLEKNLAGRRVIVYITNKLLEV